MVANKEDDAAWTSRAVSWMHLLIAFGGLTLGFGAVVIGNEQRITKLEVRQQQVIADNAAQDERYWRTVNNRNTEYARLVEKMDRIERQLTELQVVMQVHKASHK